MTFEDMANRSIQNYEKEFNTTLTDREKDLMTKSLHLGLSLGTRFSFSENFIEEQEALTNDSPWNDPYENGVATGRREILSALAEQHKI